jgi:hypothetical protein
MGLLDTIAPGKKTKQAAAAQSTQTHMRIGEIRDDTIVLKNGGLRVVLEVSSINFNLKSEQEQNSIIYAYQGFLNSLEFPIQIDIKSKKLDIDQYISQVKKLGDNQKNPLLQEQTYEYAEYVAKLVDYADIMEKKFYVVVPYDPARNLGVTKGFQSFFQRLAPKDSYTDVKRRHAEFNDLKKNLGQRINIVSSGLEQCGLKVKQLETPELIELFYETYNPLSSRTAKLRDVEETAIQTDEERIEDLENRKVPKV